MRKVVALPRVNRRLHFLARLLHLFGHDSTLLSGFPDASRSHFIDQKARALIVGWVEPKHPVEDALGLI
jgi:hypothetical protein